MKKLSLMLLCVATLATVGCKKKTTNEPTQPSDPEPTYTSPVTIDGLDTEYANLPNVLVANRPAETEYMGLKVMKVYADEVYLNIYAEYDTEYLDITENLGNEEFDGHPGVPFHVYFSKDATNGYTGQWNTPCFAMAEGFLYEAGQPREAYVPSAFSWSAAEPSDGWNWNDITTQLVDASKITDKAVEFRVMLENLPFKAEGQIYVGIDIQKGWDSTGILPRNEDAEDPGSGAMTPGVADMALVTINTVEL